MCRLYSFTSRYFRGISKRAHTQATFPHSSPDIIPSCMTHSESFYLELQKVPIQNMIIGRLTWCGRWPSARNRSPKREGEQENRPGAFQQLSHGAHSNTTGTPPTSLSSIDLLIQNLIFLFTRHISQWGKVQLLYNWHVGTTSHKLINFISPPLF